MATELGTAYVSIVAETSKLESGVKDALRGVGRQAETAGQDMGKKLASGVTQHLSNSGSDSAQKFAQQFTPKIQSTGKLAMQGLAQSMMGASEGIGSNVGEGIVGKLLEKVVGGADKAVGALEGIGAKSEGMASGISNSGMIAAAGIGLITTAALVAGDELYKIGEKWEGAAHKITFGFNETDQTKALRIRDGVDVLGAEMTLTATTVGTTNGAQQPTKYLLVETIPVLEIGAGRQVQVKF